MADDTTALVPVIAHDAAPQFVEQLENFGRLKAEVVRRLPGASAEIEGKAALTKIAFRAFRLMCNLSVVAIEERREVFGAFDDGRPNFAYFVTYRATAPNGSFVDGDGACAAVEKAPRFKCPHPAAGGWAGKTEHYPPERCPDFDPDFRWRTLPAQASEHNVRSHAHTRAFNRAVSNLVGFGEVSAEEIADEIPDADDPPHPATSMTSELPPARAGRARISPPQAKRLWAIATKAGYSDPDVHVRILRDGFAHVDEITRDKYDAICADLSVPRGHV